VRREPKRVRFPLSIWESRYFGEVFDRPFPELPPRWDSAEERGADTWATEHETREEIVDRYRRVWENPDDPSPRVSSNPVHEGQRHADD
jgi:hypothetical protein